MTRAADERKGMRRGPWFAVPSVVSVLLAVACGGGERALFSEKDLPGIALQPSEAPVGTEHSKKDSGPKPRDEFLEPFDEESRRFLSDVGLRATYQSAFGSPEVVDGDEGAAPPEDLRLVFSQLLLFDDEEGATEWLDDLVADASERVFLREVPADGLGEQSFAFGSSSLASPLLGRSVLFAWRAANLGLVLIAEGDFDDETARGLADLMDDRAS